VEDLIEEYKAAEREDYVSWGERATPSVFASASGTVAGTGTGTGTGGSGTASLAASLSESPRSLA